VNLYPAVVDEAASLAARGQSLSQRQAQRQRGNGLVVGKFNRFRHEQYLICRRPPIALKREQRLGGALAAGAYFSGGLAPLYFKSLDFLPAAEIVMHRIVWSFALLLASSFALQGLLQLSIMEIFQYIGPSFMFVFSVWLFGETLTVYSADALRHSRR
jgi:hypothetical protein